MNLIIHLCIVEPNCRWDPSYYIGWEGPRTKKKKNQPLVLFTFQFIHKYEHLMLDI